MSTNWTPNQLLAINEEGKNIIVSAGAGSGKTAVLTERILRKLLRGDQLSSLIVLTFTNAAALEMKHRIKKAISEVPSLAHLANEVDNANITTFDAYALSLVRKYHYVFNLNKDLGIGEAILLHHEQQRIINVIFDDYYLSDNQEFKDLISSFCVKDDEEIKKEILAIYQSLELVPDVEQYLQNYHHNFPTVRFDKDIQYYFETFITKPLANIDKLLMKLKIHEPEFPSLIKFQEVLKPFVCLTTYQDIKNKIPILPRLAPKTSEEVKVIKAAIASNMKAIKEATRYESLEYVASILVDSNKYSAILIQILLTLHRQYKEFKEQNQLYSFGDIAKLAIKLVKEHDNIRQEIRDNTSEILVDEYQDTSDLQEEFLSLIVNANLYMVGDVKQSIYRFRNANPSIFRKKYDDYKNKLGGMKIDLSDNFRSRYEVVETINLLFSQLMDLNYGGIDYQSDHLMIHGNKRYKELGALPFPSHLEFKDYKMEKDCPYSKEEVEIYIIARDIQEKISSNYPVFDGQQLRPCTYKDFSILLEKKKDFLLYRQIFNYLDIPLRIVDNLEITSDILIHLLSNLLNLLILVKKRQFDREFCFAYTSLARSFLFNYTDQEIFERIKSKNFKDDKIVLLLTSINVQFTHSSNRQLLDLVLDTIEFYDKLPLIGNIDKILSQLEYIYGLANTIGALSLHGEHFISYLSALLQDNFKISIPENTSVTNCVQIMSIHKSKGLEFPLIYLASLSSRFNNPDIRKKFIFSKDYGIITPYYDQGIGSTIYKTLYKYQENSDELAEKIRLLYVAATRAKERIIVVGNLKEEEVSSQEESFSLPYNSFLKMFQSLLPSIKPFISDVNIENLSIDANYRFERQIVKKLDLPAKIIKYKELKLEMNKTTQGTISKRTNDLINKEVYQKLELGNEIHQYLEYLNFKVPNLDYIPHKYQGYITAFLQSELLANVKEAIIYKEHEFIFNKDNTTYHGIIDLLLEYGDHYDVIDYKFKNIDDPEYITQLDVYRSYLSTINDKPINLYLYSLVDKKYKKILIPLPIR